MLDDGVVARTVHAARLLEMAFFDEGQWTISIGNSVVPAERSMGEDSVLIRADFPAQCWLFTPDRMAELRLNGETRDVRPIALPDKDVEFSVQWTFSVADPHVMSLRNSS